ncbi:MAG TPA: GerAB/ArcD/ProY family transporter [Bacillales bacterium]|nr:GerAB/ArcD/ProY family transporter [Bacillales bacterium]
MIKGENHVTTNQLFFLIIQTQIGVSILSLPYTVFLAAKGDGWISMLLAGGITQILILMIWVLNRRFYHSTLFTIAKRITGKWAGTLISLGYFGYFVLTGSLILILFSRTLNVWVLPKTPQWIIILLMVAAGVYIAKENLRVLARFYTFVSVLFVFLLFFMVFTLKDSNYLYLLPIGQSGVSGISQGVKAAFSSMAGFEILLVIYPYVQGSATQKLKAATYANLFVTLFYTFIILTCFMYFSPAEIALVPEPLLYMFKAFSFKIIERIDLIFLSIWVVAVTTSFMTYLYLASNGLAHCLGQRNHARLVPFTAAIIFIISIIPGENELAIRSFSQFIGSIGLVFIIVLPALLLLGAYLFRMRERRI